MRSLFFIILLIVSSTQLTSAQRVVRKGVKPVSSGNSAPQARYNISQLNGKWQEFKRSSRDGSANIEFTDTLQVHLRGVNAELREGNTMNMNMKGQARITAPNILEIAGDTYSIISLTSSELVIDDGEFRRSLKKIRTFHYETLGKQAIKQEEFSTPLVSDLSHFKGKWQVYRTSALPGYVNSNTNLIKSIEIKSDSIGRYAVGNISYHNNDVLQTRPVKISFEGNILKLEASDNKWEIYLYKLSNGEMVFGKAGELVYYAKPQ